jgi:hypothetical protein
MLGISRGKKVAQSLEPLGTPGRPSREAKGRLKTSPMELAVLALLLLLGLPRPTPCSPKLIQ